MGFRQECSYTGVAGAEVGGLYRHDGTGLPVRVLRIPSVPQVFVHVSAPPTSDGGEAHTGEHLLLGKGARGRALAAAEEMSLVESTAYTAATEVCYSFSCAAGAETFLRILEQTLEALLFPDYTDEEIRREVCHLAVVDDPTTGSLALEEKGTVYTEMVASDEKRWIVFHEVARRLYGRDHPLGLRSGGSPEAIRAMTPKRIRAFHAAHYHLSANMGLVVSLPPTTPTPAFLASLEAIIERLAAVPAHVDRLRREVLVPPARPEAGRDLVRVEYPNANPHDTGLVLFAWPLVPDGDVERHLLRRLFLETLADGETSLLHRLLIDRATRRFEVPAARVWGGLEVTRAGEGAMAGLTGYAGHTDGEAALERRVRDVQRAVDEEVARVAGLPGGHVDLTTFGRKAETRLIDLARGLKRRLSMPPQFGARGAGGGWWLEHLRLVDRQGGGARSLLLDRAVAGVGSRLVGADNPWAQVVDELGLGAPPVVGVSVPSPAEVARRARARQERLRAAEAALVTRHGGTLADALAAERTVQDAATAELEALQAAAPRPPLVPDVPRTLDDDLSWSVEPVAGVPALRARFEEMSAVEVVLSFPLAPVEPADLPLLPLLPALLTSAGLRDPATGERMAYDEVRERQEREIADLAVFYDLQPETERLELVALASGTDEAEARLAVGWLARSLLEPDLSVENLPRLRDLVDQAAKGLRAGLGGPEEGWVRNPAWALRFQDDPLFLSAASTHTKLHHLFRLRWLLEDAPSGDDAERTAALLGVLDAALGVRGAPALEPIGRGLRNGAWPEALRGDGALGSLVEALGEPLVGDDAQAWAQRWGAPLVEALGALRRDLPPASEAADLVEAARLAAHVLAVEPAVALARARDLVAAVVRTAGARLVLTGRPATVDALLPDVERLLARVRERAGEQPPAAPPDLRARPPRRVARLPEGVVAARVRARGGDAAPTLWGLVHETGSTGVLVHGAALGGRASAARDDLLDLLAASLDAGGGPHAFFMNTWAAGLAYSNGLRAAPLWGRASYYAERCPDLAQTMRFVIDLARDPARHRDPWLLEYALAQLVTGTRVTDRFEARARGMASDLADGITPEAVRAQREALLALARDEGAWAEVERRRLPALRRVLVGAGAPPGGRVAHESVLLAIAPERLLASWEAYVRATEPGEEVLRIWPGDFWLS
ncbi:MAG: hypothetical protein M9894_15280 [Planctomycetes bacterium]|nr:hypothetical protein [Planctomycetota bacterium]